MGKLRRDQQDTLYSIQNVSASISPADMFQTYYVDTTAGDVPIEVQDSTALNDEGIVKIYKVKGTNNVNVTTVGGSQNIGDSPTLTISELNKGVTIQSNFSETKYQITQDNRFGTTSTQVGFDFYFSDTVSDIGGYFDMFTAPTGEVESSDVTSTLAVGDDQALTVFATEPTEPTFTVLTIGTYTGHVHAERTAGTRDVQIYWELHKRASGGGETLLMTSSVSSLVTSKAEFNLSASLAAEEMLLSTDRLVIKWFANVSGGGSDVDVTLYMEGGNNSRVIVLTTTAALDDRYLVKGGLTGGQSASGGTAAGEDLLLGSTSNASKGAVKVATGDNFGFVDDATFMDSIKDEDDMASDSAVALATQQSIKAYVDLKSNRNLIINGNFDIWQRGTTFSSIADSTVFADRFRYRKSGAAVHLALRNTDVPTVAQSGTFSSYSTRFVLTTPDDSIAAGDFVYSLYAIEGYDWARIAQKPFTISFWVKATTTGTYCISCRNSGADRSFVAEYTVDTTETWEKKTITIDASPSSGGTWNYLNGSGLSIAFVLASGSTFHTTADAWNTGNFLSTASQVNGVATGSTSFRLAQIQVEGGDVATPFELKSIADETDRCQRYFQKNLPSGTNPGNTNTDTARVVTGQAVSAAVIYTIIDLLVTMRAAGTVTFYSDSGNTGTWDYYDGGWATDKVVTSTRIKDSNFQASIDTTGLTVNEAHISRGWYIIDSEL